APREVDEETIQVPASVRFPVEITPPDGFDPARLETWPRVEGRLEWVEGRLLYMPPCGKMQQHTVADLVTTLGIWVRSHPGFVVVTRTGESRHRMGERLPSDPRLPRLEPLVEELFLQVSTEPA